MHLEGRSDKSVTISEEEYEMLLIYKMQAENLLLEKEMPHALRDATGQKKIISKERISHERRNCNG